MINYRRRAPTKLVNPISRKRLVIGETNRYFTSISWLLKYNKFNHEVGCCPLSKERARLVPEFNPCSKKQSVARLCLPPLVTLFP